MYVKIKTENIKFKTVVTVRKLKVIIVKTLKSETKINQEYFLRHSLSRIIQKNICVFSVLL